MGGRTGYHQCFFFPRDIFLSARDNFRKTARDIKKVPVTIFGKIKLPVLNFSKVPYFSNSQHVRCFFKSVTYFEVPLTIFERVPVTLK